MPRYQTDRFGMIASYDIVEALRRAEQRRLERERRALEREARASRRVGWLARLRAVLAGPRRSSV